MRRIVLITGATSGLGRAVAIKLAELGHTVLATGKDPAKLEVLKAECPALTALLLDVTVPKHFTDAQMQIQRRGDRIDTLIVNAGVHLEHPEVWDHKPFEEWPHAEINERTFAVNYLGAMRTTDAFTRFVKRSDDGRVLFVSGTLGSFDWTLAQNAAIRVKLGKEQSAYSASKAALNMGMVQMAAREPGMFVAALCPPWLATNVGGRGGTWGAPRPVQDGVPHLVKYAASPEIVHSRTGTLISWLGDKIIKF